MSNSRLNKAAYDHDKKRFLAALSAGEKPDATTLCELAIFDSKSANLQAQNLKMIVAVLDAGVDPNELPHEDHAPAIDLASGSPNVEVVKLLLKAGAKPTADSTVHCAIAEDLDDNLQVLIDFGLDLQTPMRNDDPNDDFTPNPLEYAKELGSKKCLKILRSHLGD